jgi:ABC-2 type transport system permease protein
MAESIAQRAPYHRHLAASFSQSLLLFQRRPRTIFLGCLLLCPVLLPVASAFLSRADFAEEGMTILIRLLNDVYLKALIPLLALFQACTLISDEVDNGTIAYFLTRPVPRSAWILGKYLGFVVLATALLVPATLLVYLACYALGGLAITGDTFGVLAHYVGVLIVALAAYGALAAFLGAFVRRPIVIGLLILFAWQRLAMNLPGLIQFLTIERWLKALLPVLPTQQDNEAVRGILSEFAVREFAVAGPKALAVLGGIIVVLLGATVLGVRWREYTNARSLET